MNFFHCRVASSLFELNWVGFLVWGCFWVVGEDTLEDTVSSWVSTWGQFVVGLFLVLGRLGFFV